MARFRDQPWVLESSNVGRMRLGFPSAASSESWEHFATRPVTVKSYRFKATIGRISTVQRGSPRPPRVRKEIVKVASIGLVEAVEISRMRCTHLSGGAASSCRATVSV